MAGFVGQSDLAPENVTTFAHFSVSVAINLAKSAGVIVIGTEPSSAIRDLIAGSARPALISFLIIAASGLALGSWLAAALVVIFSLPFLLYRAMTEDRILQLELAGYSDYAARVRWRLAPGIW